MRVFSERKIRSNAIYTVLAIVFMSINVNPKLNLNIEFSDIIKLFEDYGFSQLDRTNFHLMIEIASLIGFKEEKDEKYLNDSLKRFRSQFVKCVD